MAVARGLSIVRPGERFLVKLCNFGKDQVIVRKNSTLGFAEPYQGPMLSAVLDDKISEDDPQLALRHFARLSREYGPYTYVWPKSAQSTLLVSDPSMPVLPNGFLVPLGQHLD